VHGFILFQKACEPFAPSHRLFVPVDKFYRAGTVFAFIPCFAKWVVVGVWQVVGVWVVMGVST